MTDWAAFTGFSGLVVVLLVLLARASQAVMGDVELAREADAEASEGDSTTADEPAAAGSSERNERRERPGPESRLEREAETVDTSAGPKSGSADDADALDGSRGSHESESAESGPPEGHAESPEEVVAGHGEWNGDGAPTADAGGGPARDVGDRGERNGLALTSGELLVNVLLTHGLFGSLVVGGALFWDVPFSALGITRPSFGTVALGVGIGAGLYVLNEVGALVAERLGFGPTETLRELLTPDSIHGWLLLLGAVLPIVAVVEELLFRGLLVGAFAIGLGLPQWALAVGSSVLFGAAHAAQGRGGILVTAVLGLVLAGAFILFGSLLLVIVVHYLVNALEFVVHEGLGIQWAERGT